MVKAKITGVKQLDEETYRISAIDFDALYTIENGPFYEFQMWAWCMENFVKHTEVSSADDLVGKTMLIDLRESVVGMLSPGDIEPLEVPDELPLKIASMIHAEDIEKIDIIEHNTASSR